MKDTTMKNKTLYIILAGLMFILLACGDDGGCGKDGIKCTPEHPPIPTIEPGSVNTIHYSN